MSKQENKFEKLITYIINEDETNAKALFHQIVVEKSRNIYEGLVDEDQFPVQKGRSRNVQRGLGADSLSDEISDHQDVVDGDEYGMHEADESDDEFEVPSEDEFGSDDDSEFDTTDGEDEFGGSEEGEGELEDRVMDLEDAIDELKAEFDQLMAGEENEEENFPGIHDDEGADSEDEFGSSDDESEFGSSDDEDEEQQQESASVYEAKSKKGVNPFSKKDNKKSSEDDEELDNEKKVKKSRKSPADLMREYVEKVTAIKPVEGDYVGTGAESGAKPTVNKQSTQISGKNDMGGSSANIARGGSEQAPDGTSPKKAANYGTKGQGNLPGAGSFENRPGAKAGQTFKKSTKVASKEGSPAGAKNTNSGTINTKSPDQATGGKPGFKG